MSDSNEGQKPVEAHPDDPQAFLDELEAKKGRIHVGMVMLLLSLKDTADLLAEVTAGDLRSSIAAQGLAQMWKISIANIGVGADIPAEALNADVRELTRRFDAHMESMAGVAKQSEFNNPQVLVAVPGNGTVN